MSRKKRVNWKRIATDMYNELHWGSADVARAKEIFTRAAPPESPAVREGEKL